MAISQAQADKAWADGSAGGTPLMAADLKALSKRDRDYRSMVPTGWTSIDEFDDDTLDPAWVRVDSASAPAANASWTERGDSLSLANNGGTGNGNINALVRPIGTAMVAGDAFVAGMRYLSQNLVLGGIVLSDSATAGSGNQVLAAYWDNGNVGPNQTGLMTGTNWTGFSGSGTTYAGGRFLRLVMTAANAWRFDLSPDGISWVTASTVSKTLTPTYVGFATSSWGTGGKGVISHEFLRRVSGVS